MGRYADATIFEVVVLETVLKHKSIAVLQDVLRKVYLVEKESDVDALILSLLDKEPTILAFLNAHGFNLAWNQRELAECFLRSDVLLRDGKGLEFMYRWLGRSPGLNLNGTDLIPRILERARGKRIAIFGTQEPWLGKTSILLQETGHEIVSLLDGFQEDAAYLNEASRVNPEIILLAMGMPRQEQMAWLIKSSLINPPSLIICGGAIVDFIAGRFPRAPVWMRKYGLEWLFRFYLEPKRLFSRYIIGVFVFARHAWQLKYTKG